MGSWVEEFGVEEFRPHRWLGAAHVQTLVGNVMRSDAGVSFRRERLETADGDFIDLDFADVAGYEWAKLGENAPIVLVIHGLEGSARRGYMNETYRQVARRGMRPVGMNLRSCSGEINRLAGSYHAGATGDISFVVMHLLAQFPQVTFGVVGFSLGGNMTLKYLGEQGEALPERVRVGAAVSPPMQMVKGIRALNEFPGMLYGRYFLRNLKRKTRQKETILPDNINLEAVLKSRTLQEFDEYATAPLFGFEGALDYYRQCSCAQFLGGVARPTLILRSKDDPVIHHEDIPAAETFTGRPCLKVVVTERGGHVGFIEQGMTFWAERQVARFMERGLVVEENRS